MHAMKLYLYTFATLLLLFVPDVSMAAGNYTVSPIIIDHSLEKREMISETIVIKNNDSRVLRFYATVNAIELDDGGAIESFVPPSMADNSETVTSWIEITRARIQLDPGETREIPVKIHVNPQAKSGQYHAFIGFGTGSKRFEAEQQVVNGDARGVIVRIGLDEEVQEFLKLDRFTVERFVTDLSAKVISYTIQNPSAVPVTPRGEIILYDSRGRENGAIEVNADGQAIPPKEELTFETTVPDTGSFGRHKAYLSVDYGENLVASLNDTQFFYVVPIKQLIIIFAVVLLMATITTVVLHRRFGGAKDDFDDELGEDVRLYVRDGTSVEKSEHDLDLKSNK